MDGCEVAQEVGVRLEAKEDRFSSYGWRLRAVAVWILRTRGGRESKQFLLKQPLKIPLKAPGNML